LTPKHIDIEELANCTSFEEKLVGTLLLEPKCIDGGVTYPVPVPDFQFSVYTAPSKLSVHLSSAEILLPLDADLELIHENGEVLTLKKGQSVFIPAFAGEYMMSSEGRVAKAHC
jgi:mannose-6-phosphate isomerase